MRVERYIGIENYARLVESQDFSRSYSYGPKASYNSGSWNSGIGFTESIRLAKEGDPSLVSQASETVDKLVNEFQIKQDVRKRYCNSVAGSRVSVPEYLAGSPFCMKRKMPTEMSNRSVNIYVGVVCSAGIDAKNMLKRGMTILALLEFLQLSQVSVSLSLLVETHGYTDGDLIQVIQVESSPLDLSTASFAISHPAFARNITYAMAEKLDGFNGSWPTTWHQSNYLANLRKNIGMSELDIYIKAPHSSNEDIMRQPEKWLENNIQTIKGNL